MVGPNLADLFEFSVLIMSLKAIQNCDCLTSNCYSTVYFNFDWNFTSSFINELVSKCNNLLPTRWGLWLLKFSNFWWFIFCFSHLLDLSCTFIILFVTVCCFLVKISVKFYSCSPTNIIYIVSSSYYFFLVNYRLTQKSTRASHQDLVFC